MFRASLDTNVLASGVTTSRSSPPPVSARIVKAWRDGAFELVVSEHIITELVHTFQSPYFRERISLEQVAGTVALLREESIVTPLTVAVSGVATHPEDDRTLATAVSGKASYLVTNDRPFLEKVGRTYQGVTLLTPPEFLSVLRSEEKPAA